MKKVPIILVRIYAIMDVGYMNKINHYAVLR